MKKSEWDKIPKRFFYGAYHDTEADTVGKLKALLDELPDSLEVHCELGGFVTLVVEGHSRDCYLNFLNCD